MKTFTDYLEAVHQTPEQMRMWCFSIPYYIGDNKVEDKLSIHHIKQAKKALEKSGAKNVKFKDQFTTGLLIFKAAPSQIEDISEKMRKACPLRSQIKSYYGRFDN